jgi:hypothetical protein
LEVETSCLLCIAADSDGNVGEGGDGNMSTSATSDKEPAGGGSTADLSLPSILFYRFITAIHSGIGQMSRFLQSESILIPLINYPKLFKLLQIPSMHQDLSVAISKQVQTSPYIANYLSSCVTGGVEAVLHQISKNKNKEEVADR